MSASLRVAMARVCRAHGLKMGEFVETAIRERMERLKMMDQAGRAAKARGKRSPEEVRKAWDELSARVTRLWQGPGGAVEAIREQREKTW